MPRAPRIVIPHGIYHVTANAIDERPLFEVLADRMDFLVGLAKAVARCEWLCLGYCQLGTHYHLLIQTPRANLSEGMHRLNTRYVKRFNARHGRRGHLLRARFDAVDVTREEHLLETHRYIDLNPVRAGMCRHPADWRWSSFRALAGLAPRPGFLAVQRALAAFASPTRTAEQTYIAFVLAGIDTV